MRCLGESLVNETIWEIRISNEMEDNGKNNQKLSSDLIDDLKINK